MIHFFRRIRQGLLSQSRLSKYLLYAIGEIILVVIGILIALQINNWNEQRKKFVAERASLIELTSALESDFVHFQRGIQALNRQLDIIDALILEVNDSLTLKPNPNAKLGYVRWVAFFRPITKESHANELDKIMNQSIKNGLLDYFRSEEYVREAFSEYKAIIIEKLRTFLAKKGILNSMSVFESDVEVRTDKMLREDRLKEHLKTVEFDQILFESRLKTFEAKEELENLLNKNRELNSKIKSTLEQ